MASKQEAWPFPWEKPLTHYDSDGPDGRVSFTLEGHTFAVEPSGGTGIHTGRDRFRVVCSTCTEVLHANTTGPGSRIRSHLNTTTRKAGPTICEVADCGRACGPGWTLCRKHGGHPQACGICGAIECRGHEAVP